MIYSVYYDTGASVWTPRWMQPPSARLPLYQRPRRKRPMRGQDLLEQLSDATGGRFYRSTVGDLGGVFAKVTEELRHGYLLGFYPDGSRRDGSVHGLGVEVSRPDARVRSRRSYRAPAGADPN